MSGVRVVAAVFRTVSACLLFGNMQFKQERNSDQATLPDNTVAQQVGQTPSHPLIFGKHLCNNDTQLLWFSHLVDTIGTLLLFAGFYLR